YANGSYTYNGKYMVSLSGRRDASNLFGLNTNDQWNPLWSAGGSWELSREKFWRVAAVSYLRLRATYGFSGNIDPSMSAVTTIAYIGTSLNTPAQQAQFRNYFNPDLTWERSAMMNFGLDFRMAGSRLSGSIEYFNKKGTNLYGNALIDYTGGVGTSIVKNVASTKGTGVDIELNSLNVSSGKFSWTSNLNASFYKDQVLKYYLSSQQASSYVNESTSISGVEGKPVYSIFAYKWAGLDPANGNPRGYLNGQISTDYAKLTGSAATIKDLNYHGSALPTAYGSVGNTFTYKNFSITARLSYKLGYYFRRTTLKYNSLYSQGTGNADFAQRWQKPGDEVITDVPSMIYPGSSSRDLFYSLSDALVEKGDHIRLQYVNFAYEMNRQQYNFLPFKTLSIYVNAANLGLLWAANKYHLDPDYRAGNVLKPSKTFSLGLRANLN
ncbi:MAG TPA: SusC/RagA family TonB-linked outer membrane protein, partial [Pedobacter sp.]